PLFPAYSQAVAATAAAPSEPLHWRTFDGGIAEIGAAGYSVGNAAGNAAGAAGFCFDNETPRHRVYLQPYRLASRLATNGEYAAFIEAGGYEDPALWLSDAWDWRSAEKREHPLYWRRGGEAGRAESRGWMEFTLHGLQPLAAERPAVHLSYYEADAFARWSGARLPSEAEWEHAAAQRAREFGQLFGEAWQWTSSSYSPYPGFQPAAGAVGEYNGKFMVNQYVLRGGSCATPDGHSRASYRNFFPASACWQFSGIRLARDGP
ncbi:MAG TPA: SUMF1/EgtB/PvdO family nonheme iron enzyme, partial [Burkholderiales bacterium]|nr:SUMF1/EgtB/PvdO family nonheme iron enzyme [Burkholderiales bacterium]